MTGIRINGEDRTVARGTTLRALLEELALPASRVAVERNRSIVRKEDYGGTILEEGDLLEIVTFVGGG